MKFIQNLKIRDKLLILLFILLLPLIIFVTFKFRTEIKLNNELKEISARMSESEKISRFVHEFQKERALILNYSTGDSVFRTEVVSQREETDAAINTLAKFIEESERDYYNLSLINDLKKYRNDLDENKLNTREFRSYADNLIYTFLDKIDDNATHISNVEVRRQLLSFVNLVEVKVHLGRIRSLLMRKIREEKFNLEDYALFISQKDFYTQALKDFRRYASEKSYNEVQKHLKSDDFKDINNVIQQLQSNPDSNLANLHSQNIYSEFTRGIEALRMAEDILINEIQTLANEESSKKERGLIWLMVVIIVSLGLATILSFYIINIISKSLASLKTAADAVTRGVTDLDIPVYSKDEIGNLAESFRGVINKNKYLSEVTQAIGEGRYDIEVHVADSDDILSNSIKNMKENLTRFSRETERRNWILSGMGALNDLVSGVNQLNQLSEKIIFFLSSYTGADLGVLYLHDGSGKLTASASYGINDSLEAIPSFRLGSGVVGQAVKNHEIKILTEVPAQHMKIKTSLSETEPNNIIIIPLHFSNNIVGVIELGTRQKYSGREQDFFKFASERIAIVIHTLKSHIQTQELLYETQNQAEELESQQEELRQLNAELKASEEELKVNQEELHEKNAELEEKAQLLEEQYEAVNTRNKALDDAKQAIELKIQQVESVSKYKSDFLANMSHELRTPLNSILILSRLLADNKDKNLNAKQAEHAQIIHNSGSDLLKLINEILDLSKIESGQVKLEIEETKIKDIKLEQGFKELAKSKNIDFAIYYAPDLPKTIVTDRFRLEQVIRNFLSNAFKFTEKKGSVQISVHPLLDKSVIRSENLRRQTDIVAFSVKDTGIGISEDKQELIFEAFQQADASTTRKHGGTGLGLTISKELASLLGGEIRLQSKQGEGSTFTLFVPRVLTETRKNYVEPEVNAATKSEKSISNVLTVLSKENHEKKDITVLIIEDDKGFNRILCDFAHAKKFKVHQAYTGQEGLELARQIIPDAILLDINLPDITGWEVLKQIRNDKNLRLVNVHVMSAYDHEVMDNFESNEEYLPKPVTLEMLDKAFNNISTITEKSIETVLIVEDNEIENKAVSELLLTHNIKSISAYSAEEAETILAKNKVDCIILDLNLPGKNGYDWMEKVKSQKALSSIPIIIYSGKDLSREEETKIKKFANTIIIKNEYSYIRLLDEVQLFLHKINQKLPFGDEFKMKLHIPEEILKDKKVLIVDDDIRNIYSLFNMLEIQGMNIETAHDGKEALNKLETVDNIDIVLMDIMMPEMDGIEATKRIRQNYKFKNLPVIALTAKAMAGDREKCIAAGASDYITKPVDMDKLLTLMRVWLYER